MSSCGFPSTKVLIPAPGRQSTSRLQARVKVGTLRDACHKNGLGRYPSDQEQFVFPGNMKSGHVRWRGRRASVGVRFVRVSPLLDHQRPSLFPSVISAPDRVGSSPPSLTHSIFTEPLGLIVSISLTRLELPLEFPMRLSMLDRRILSLRDRRCGFLIIDLSGCA